MHGRIWGAGILVWLMCGMLVAQEAASVAARGPAEGPERGEAPAGPVTERKPDVYLLRGEDGQWKKVLDLPYEVFSEAYRVMLGLENPPPRYTLDSLSAAGTVRDRYAELTVTVQVRLHDGNWVEVPLRLNQALVRGPMEHGGEAEYRFQFNEAGEGHVLWVRGEADRAYTFTFPVLVPLDESGGKWRLALSAPASANSQLNLRVPLARAAGSVSGRAEIVSTTGTDAGETEFVVTGLDGGFQLSWWEVDSRPQPARPTLEASGGLITVSLDEGVVNTTARLRVLNRAGPFDEFRVRLPEGTEWVGQGASGYSVVPQPRNGTKNREVLGIRFTEAQSGPVTVELTCRRLLEDSDRERFIELAGFEVLGAVRQQGHISVRSPGTQYVQWGPNRAVRAVPLDQLPETLRAENVVAVFEYRSQPCSLTARLADRQTRIDVEPTYLVEVEKGAARLTATLKYAIRGGEVLAFDLEVPDWDIEEVEPDSWVAAERLEGEADPDGGGVRHLVLSRPEVDSPVRQVTLVIRAHRTLDPAADSVRLGFPRPRPSESDAATLQVRPGWVAIVAADNVELSCGPEALEGLTPRPGPAPAGIPADPDTLLYRIDDPEALFVATRTVHERSMRVEVSSRLQLVPGKEEMEQVMSYAVAYETVSRLSLEMPQELASRKGLEVFLDGEPVSVADPPDQREAVASSGTVIKEVRLSSPGMGKFQVVVRFPCVVNLEALEPETGLACAVPLVMPRDGELVRNELEVTTKPGIRVAHQDPPWTIPENGPRGGGLRLVADEAVTQVRLGVVLDDPAALGSTTVLRAWIQTWIYRDGEKDGTLARRDRAVFRFLSDQPTATVLLPRGVGLGAAEFLLDQKPLKPGHGAGAGIRIPLPSVGQGGHCLEIQYSCRMGRRGPGPWSLELPRMGGQPWVQRCYWQLVLPENEHVVVGPAPWTQEYRWGWTGLFWGRLPVMDQAELEAWVGAPHRRPPPAGTNRYLFSLPGAVDSCRLRTASRSWIVLAGSGLALAVGLLWVYLPLGRHPVVGLIGVIALVAAVILYPGPALLLAQAAALGMGLAVLASLLARALGARPGGFGRETGSSILEKGSTQVYREPSGIGDRASTQTAPAAAPASISEPS